MRETPSSANTSEQNAPVGKVYRVGGRAAVRTKLSLNWQRLKMALRAASCAGARF